MSKYAVIFNSQLTPSHIADQLIYVEEGFNYIEGEPCVKIDLSNLEVYGKQGGVYLNGDKLGGFPAHNFHSAECFVLPAKFIHPHEINEKNENIVLIDLDYEDLIKTTLSKGGSSFTCFGNLEVKS